MTNEVPPPQDQRPSYDPKAVYANGQAIGLIASLVDGIRRDLLASEARMMEEINQRFDSHVIQHQERLEATDDIHRNLSGRVNLLEKHVEAEQLAEATHKAYRNGQLMIVKSSMSFLDRNKVWLLPVIAALLGSTVLGPVLDSTVRTILGR